jgi:large conductance mechanosensitive channel
MKIFSEFREFISRGNVIDLAVGVIIGAAFNKIVSALVDEVIMPVIGLLTAGVDFAQLKVVLKPADPITRHAEVAIKYGDFINAIVQFLIVAATVFFLVKTVNMLRRLTDRQQQEAQAAETPPAPTPTEALLMEIRDELKGRSPAPGAQQAGARTTKAQSAKAPAQKRSASRKPR